MQWYGRWEKGENSTFVGPGHPSVVGDWLVYHAWLYDHIAADQVTQLIINLIKYEERHLKNRRSPEGSFSLISFCGQRRSQQMVRPSSCQGWQGEGLQTLNNQDLKQIQPS